MPKVTPLSCGGKGPCCHVGYSHRHCEHCDMVIDTRAYAAPYLQPYFQWFYRSQPGYWMNGQYWTTNTYQVAGSNVTSGYVGMSSASEQSVSINETTEHTCAALPSG